MTTPVLSLRSFGVAFGERIILSAVDLTVADRQVTTLMGPAGTGKSTLLRTVAGFNDANPSLRTWGQAEYLGAGLEEANRPALVAQSAQLMMSSVLENIVTGLPERNTLTPAQQRELARRLLAAAGLDALGGQLDDSVVRLPLAVQRRLAILRVAATGARLVCIDEPTAGLDRAEAFKLLDYILQESAHRSILIVLHNQEQVRHLGGVTALLAGGLVQEAGDCADFFAAPKTAAGRDFARSGSCSVPAPDAHPSTLDEATAAPPPVPKEAASYVSDSFGPRGFLWLKHGRLAGTPKPGVFLDIHYDLKALVRVGVTCLVSLTETPVDTEALAAHPIRSIRFPIPDMKAPSPEAAALLCGRIETLLAQGEVVAVHCRAGLGRTGTVLAAYLIWEGSSALSALEKVRRVEPRWVQSQEQVAFLETFAAQQANGSVQRQVGQSTPSNDEQLKTPRGK